MITPVFKHTKTGNHYEILADNATIEATGERAVIYRSLSNNSVWVRPFDEFFGEIAIEGETVPRFQRLTF